MKIMSARDAKNHFGEFPDSARRETVVVTCCCCHVLPPDAPLFFGISQGCAVVGGPPPGRCRGGCDGVQIGASTQRA